MNLHWTSEHTTGVLLIILVFGFMLIIAGATLTDKWIDLQPKSPIVCEK